jgi:hypothetical protein
MQLIPSRVVEVWVAVRSSKTRSGKAGLDLDWTKARAWTAASVWDQPMPDILIPAKEKYRRTVELRPYICD